MKPNPYAVRRYLWNHPIQFEVQRIEDDEPIHFISTTLHAERLAELINDKAVPIEVLPMNRVLFLGWNVDEVIKNLGNDQRAISVFNALYGG
jgi:hypothetical protein